MGLDLYINIITKDSAAGAEYVAGSAPLANILNWKSTAEMDRAGQFSFAVVMDASNRALLQRLRKVRCYMFMNDQYIEIGSGIIDSINMEIEDGVKVLRVSGNDMLKELTYLSVGDLELTDTLFGISHADALASIAAYAPAGWTFTPSGTPNNDFAYHKYTGDTVLAALVYLVEATQTHFCLTGFRTLEFKEAATDTGLVIAENADGADESSCGIVSVRKQQLSHDLITRIYPYGAGTGAERFTMAETDRSAPSGYTLDAVNNYIKHNNHETNYDRIERHIQFSQVSPKIANREVNAVTAANMLFDLAYNELKRRIDLFENDIYEIELASCKQKINPLDAVWVYFNDPETGLQINQSMWVMSSEINVSSSGIQTTRVTVSGQPIRDRSESEILLDNLRRVSSMQSTHQPTTGSYSVDFTGTVQNPGSDLSVQLNFPPDIDTSYDITLYFTFTSANFTLADLGVIVDWSDEAISGYYRMSTNAVSLGNSWYSFSVGTGSKSFNAGLSLVLTMNDWAGAPVGTATITGFVRAGVQKTS